MADGDEKSDNPGSGPVGQGDFIVGEGDCIFSIAFNAGHDWNTLWNLSDNADLKEKRKNPNYLLPGDKVKVPPITIKELTLPGEQRHKFKLKNTPVKLVLRVMQPPDVSKLKAKVGKEPANPEESLNVSYEDPDPPEAQEDMPWANVSYRVEIDGKTTAGNAGGDGKITVSMPPSARSGMLYLNQDGKQEGGPRTMPLALGGLAPPGELMGIKQRLMHLGFDCGDTDNDEQSPGFMAAIHAYREKHKLGSGGLDQDLIDEIKQEHGS